MRKHEPSDDTQKAYWKEIDRLCAEQKAVEYRRNYDYRGRKRGSAKRFKGVKY